MEKYFHFDRSKTLQELEGKDWGEPTFNSHLVVTCHRLRRKAIGGFTVEDLRIMIGQAIGLDYLIPLAIETLEDNIFTDGDYYCGDLLDSVLRVDVSFWLTNPSYKEELEDIIKNNLDDLKNKLDTFQQKFIK